MKKKFAQVLFLGAPGVGKGTYARRAAPVLGFGHISPGDLLRKVGSSDPTIRPFLEKGALVPEEVVFGLVKMELACMREERSGVILDGFPRSRDQAQGWMERAGGSVPDLVVEFQLPEDLLIQKLLGRRTCSSCGDLYNVYSFNEGDYAMPAMLPQREGLCDKCGSHLVQRVDDKIEVIENRLKQHWEQEGALIEYLRSRTDNVVKFDVKTGIAQVGELVSLIKHKLEK